MTVLIVGASTAGARTAQMLRLKGFDDEIVLVGAEGNLPYDKPPLSKGMLAADAPAEPEPLLAAEEYAHLGITLRLGNPATSLDMVQREVVLADGDGVRFDQIVIATGVKARQVPGAEGLEGVHTLRSAADAVALRRGLASAQRVVVIGAGFIGAEVACAARAYGCSVDIIEMQPIPMAHVLGADVAGRIATLHSEHGVTVHTGAAFARFEGTARVNGVTLTDGRTLAADLVVVGVGAAPAVDWLQTSGIPLDNGIRCDQGLRVLGVPAAFAVGDVAAGGHPFHGEVMRVEHWTNANEHVETVVATMMGLPAPRPRPLYVWSDQYGEQIQIVGRPAAGVSHVLRESAGARGLVAAYVTSAGIVAGGVAVSNPRAFLKLRRAVAARSHVDDLDLGELARPTSAG